MYLLKDSFHTHDSNRQSYSFSVERHTETANLHAWVQEDSFHLASVGNRHILNTPTFTRGTLEMTLGFNCMAEIKPGFIVMFQYDEAARKGSGLRFDYDLNRAFEIALVDVDGLTLTVKAKAMAELSEPSKEQLYPFSLRIDGEIVSGSIAGAPFALACHSAIRFTHHTFMSFEIPVIWATSGARPIRPSNAKSHHFLPAYGTAHRYPA